MLEGQPALELRLGGEMTMTLALRRDRGSAGDPRCQGASKGSFASHEAGFQEPVGGFPSLREPSAAETRIH